MRSAGSYRTVMQRIIGGVLVLALGQGARAGDTPATPAEQYRALLKEYDAGPGGGATSDAARRDLIGRVFKVRHDVALKLVDLAEKHPEDPIAVDALIRAAWQVNTEPWPVGMVGATDGAGVRALALLRRDHLSSEKLATVCERISYGYCEEYETFLRAVLEGSPHREVQGVACLALGRFLGGRLQKLDVLGEDPGLLAEFEALFGKEYIDGLRKRSRAEADEEAGAFLVQAAERFGDVKTTGQGTVGEKAEAALFELRHLCVGREAPDIEGVDQDGRRFKLSDYRGKVVLLDFWHQY